jgi:hypothetical protein
MRYLFTIIYKNESKETMLEKRVIENSTSVILTVGETVIPATLNNTKATQDLISKLPYTITLHHYEYDYCGVMDEQFEYDKKTHIAVGRMEILIGWELL